MPEFDEPLDDYSSFFRDEHQRNVSEYFENLVKSSGVDEQKNIDTIVELQALQRSVSDSSASRGWWKAARVFSILASIGLTVLALAQQGVYYLSVIPAGALVALLLMKINPEIAQLNEKVADLEGKRDSKSDEAWLQMHPLNELHTWEAAPKLLMKTFPFITLDNYFSATRLQDLTENYNLSPSFNDGRSIQAIQSGTFKGNPFVVTRYKEHWMGTRTYTGSLVIYWTESVRDAQGNWVNVQRTQTLTASVVKPYPEYQVRSSIIYGHEVAPNLSFSRGPSKLSGLEDGLMNNWRKDHAIKKVEKKARKDIKSGAGELTVMSNKEFETLFNAIDRDHEVEFRLLFTPLAQQEMVKLLNDKEIGYGDNFTFHKQGKVNFVEPNHLAEVEFDGNPQMFKTLELAEARRIFNEFHNDYFKSMYFSFAPIWTIPMYRENRTLPALTENTREVAFWEHEAMANLLGQENFRHPDSITENILKTSAHGSGSTKNVTVTAYGYEGIARVDVIPMAGGDGNVHGVPVPWTEYIDVSQDSSMAVGALSNNIHDDNSEDQDLQNSWQKKLAEHGFTPDVVLTRGAIGAVLLR